MIRLICCVLLTSCIAAAPATPATRPAKPQADLNALHVKAVELMRLRDFRKAALELDKVYTATPPAQRNRALVLNRAIIDLTQKTFIMRGVKDLTEYLTKNRDPDEHATNILGGALNVAAADARRKRGDLWQNAFREWDRRNYVLDHSRKGWRRWGTRWVSEAEYAQIQADIQSLKQAVADQQAVADRAYDRAWSLGQQHANALNAKEKARYIIQYLQWNNGNYNLPQNTVSLNPSDPNYLQFQQPAVLMDYTNAYLEAQRLGPEMEVALRTYHREITTLRELENKVIRPEWPTQFEPVDPNGPEADKPIDTGPAPATAPAAEEPSKVPGKPLPPSPRAKLYK